MSQSQPKTAFTLGRDLYLAALPEQLDLALFVDLTQHWKRVQFDQQSGPIFDEVNGLHRTWWHDGSPAAFQACTNAICALGAALGFPRIEPVH